MLGLTRIGACGAQGAGGRPATMGETGNVQPGTYERSRSLSPAPLVNSTELGQTAEGSNSHPRTQPIDIDFKHE